MMVNRLECPPCGHTVDYLTRDKEIVCECGEFMEFSGKVGCVQSVADDSVPIAELEALVERWNEAARHVKGQKPAEYDGIMGCSDELRQIIDDYTERD